MTRGLGLGVLGASYVGHTRDGTRRGARGWCEPGGLEVVGCDVRREGKSRGRQGGEPGARGRTVTIGSLNVAVDVSRDLTLLEHAAHAGFPYGPVCVVKNVLRPWNHVAFICRNNCYGQSCCNYRGRRSSGIATSIICHNVSNRGCLGVRRKRTNES
jgi:hypothetical protein